MAVVHVADPAVFRASFSIWNDWVGNPLSISKPKGKHIHINFDIGGNELFEITMLLTALFHPNFSLFFKLSGFHNACAFGAKRLGKIGEGPGDFPNRMTRVSFFRLIDPGG